jgi:hypothetical protein
MLGARAGLAAPTGATMHPIFAAVPDAPRADEAHKLFAGAVAQYKLGPVEVIDAPGPPAPRAAELLRTGREAVEKKRFADALTALNAAAAEAIATGGAGLEPAQLAEVFLYQGMAIQKADWKDLKHPLTEIAPPTAKEAYLRAATLALNRVLYPRDFPPLAVESWRLATSEISRRPRGTILVKAPSSALVSVDGGPLHPGPQSASDLCYGDHFIRVEDPGRQPWAVLVPLSLPLLDVDVPESPALTVADAEAAAHARRQGATFALLAELGPGRPGRLELRLIDAATGQRRDATVLPFPGQPDGVVAALMRFDEMARKARFGAENGVVAEPRGVTDFAVAPVAATVSDKPRFSDNPTGWARARWPLVSAIGVAVGSAVILGIMVAHNDGK